MKSAAKIEHTAPKDRNEKILSTTEASRIIALGIQHIAIKLGELYETDAKEEKSSSKHEVTP